MVQARSQRSAHTQKPAAKQPPLEVVLLVRARVTRRHRKARVFEFRTLGFSAYLEPLPTTPCDDDELQQVTDWVSRRGLKVTAVSAVQHCIVARGPAARVQAIFGSGRGQHFAVPKELADVVREVFASGGAQAATLPTKVPERWGVPADPRQVAHYYRFPRFLHGQGQTVGLILLGGGFHRRDLETYFRRLSLPVPEIVVVAKDGQPNAPAAEKYLAAYARAIQSKVAPKFPASGRNSLANVKWTWETTQGIQVAGAFANAARIVVYFGRNNEAGRFQVLARAIRDHEHAPSVLCCSWHIGFEDEVMSSERLRLNRLFREAGRRGITICAASGDWGDGAQAPGAPTPPRPRVCFPASSPHVLACGGSSHLLRPKTGRETVWSEIISSMAVGSGGGVSRLFALPRWQHDAGVVAKTRRSGRGVPDVAAKANLEGGYLGILGGVEIRNGGTSAAAPVWASLIALLNQALGVRLGFVNPLLYHPKVRRSMRAIVFGKNGAHFEASRGWNPCTGLGTPIVAALLRTVRRYGAVRGSRGPAPVNVRG